MYVKRIVMTRSYLFTKHNNNLFFYIFRTGILVLLLYTFVLLLLLTLLLLPLLLLSLLPSFICLTALLWLLLLIILALLINVAELQWVDMSCQKASRSCATVLCYSPCNHTNGFYAGCSNAGSLNLAKYGCKITSRAVNRLAGWKTSSLDSKSAASLLAVGNSWVNGRAAHHDWECTKFLAYVLRNYIS